jgi:tRNA-dependent cyclodipeptide synthase
MDIPDTDHLIIGMSPFNPHFSLDWIISAFRSGADHFATVDVLHPGAIATSLLTATGTPEGRALRRARQQCSKKLRTVAAAVEQSGVVLGRTSPLLNSDHIVEPNYAGRREQVADEYLRNTEFRCRCLAMSSAATQSRLRAIGSSTPPDPGTAVDYVLDELPAYTHRADLFHYPSAALSYPAPWPAGEDIRAGETSLDTDPNSHFFVLDPEPEAHHV